ncbi:hypothetical protein [Streptomyces sp. NPDC017529]|uniref:hypothetical protein n=1 Tax=Streptomyces sp. NPDC017529 TaxID=3365000 RepID=UPI0037B0AE9A
MSAIGAATSDLEGLPDERRDVSGGGHTDALSRLRRLLDDAIGAAGAPAEAGRTTLIEKPFPVEVDPGALVRQRR